jgi:H+/Cl- antiporter ClcA
MNPPPKTSPDLLTRGLVSLRQGLGAYALIGLVAGLLGAAYLALLHMMEHVLGPGTRSGWSHVAVMIAAGITVGILVRWLGHPGDVELLVDNIHIEGGRGELRHLRSLLPVSLVCISTGGAAGPEAPLVQTTGSLAAWLGQFSKLPESKRRSMTIAGMAAAFTVLFGAPLGSAIFALEILHRRGLEYYEALLPALVSALVAYVVYVASTGLGLSPVWYFPEGVGARPIDLAWVTAAGVLGALAAILFTYAVKGAGRLFQLVPTLARPAVGGLVLGLLGLATPFALTFGKHQIEPLEALQGGGLVFLLVALAKVSGTAVTVASGWRGGFIIPLFFIGAALARMLHAWLPETNEVVMTAALMAAVNTGVTKTPIGSTLVVVHMAGLRLVPTTLLAAVVALLLTSQVGLLETQRERGTIGHRADKPAG